MSFDTEFDYTALKDFITSAIGGINFRLGAIATEIAEFQGITGYNSIADESAEQISMLQETEKALTRERDAITALQPQIAAAEALSAGDKQKIYDFWVIVQEQKLRYMCRIITHHTAMCADTEFNALISDETHTAKQLKMIGEKLCRKFPMEAYCYAYLQMLG
jgi:hypothetical protein